MPYFEISLLARCTVVIEAADAKQAEIHAMTIDFGAYVESE
ncbi:hypothetical protein ACKBF4_09450 [Pseudomonas aeruginosa]